MVLMRYFETWIIQLYRALKMENDRAVELNDACSSLHIIGNGFVYGKIKNSTQSTVLFVRILKAWHFKLRKCISHQERSHLRILVSTKGAAIVKWSSRTQIMRKRYFENILSLKSQDTGPRYPKLVPRDPNFCLMIFLIQP